VVAGKHDDGRAGQVGHGLATDQADLQRQRLEPAQRSGRLGLVVDGGLQRGAQRFVERRDGRQGQRVVGNMRCWC
jgi:hypothetical protein